MLYYGITDVGKKRQRNEDCFVLDNRNGLLVAVVCDGMGGANGGSVASSLACETFTAKLHELYKKENFVPESAISEAVDDANNNIYQVAVDDMRLAGMGTTLVACLVFGGKMYTVNVGDSRIYNFNGGEIKQITVDHSFVQALVDSGEITAAEAEHHPKKNVILRAVGVESHVRCDIKRIDEPCGTYLICSDGMSNYFDKDKFCEILSSDNDIITKAESLVNYANECGGADNITVALIEM